MNFSCLFVFLLVSGLVYSILAIREYERQQMAGESIDWGSVLFPGSLVRLIIWLILLGIAGLAFAAAAD